MKIVKTYPNALTQPLFGSNSKHPPDPPLDKAKLWRKAADKIRLSDPARLRLEWMIFYYTLGRERAYPTARQFGTTPRNFYKWLHRFEKQGVRGLEEHSRAPHQTRQWEVTRVEEDRIKELREQYLHYGKAKLKVIYAELYDEPVSTWKIERVIRRHKLYPPPNRPNQLVKKKGKPKPRIAQLEIRAEPYFLFHLDTIVIYYGSLKRYIITAIDHNARVGYARMYTTPSSKSARDFLYRLHYLVGEPIVHVHTDNGSEFAGTFETALAELNIPHWFSRVKTPKDNARCERFNETLQYEWLLDGNFNPNVDEFNRELTKWLVEYNFLRPHQALNYLTPMRYLESKQAPSLLPMWSASTPD
jgi:transposase InsO family protein